MGWLEAGNNDLWGHIRVKLAALLLLLAGWTIVISTLPLLPSLSMRAVFVLAGMAVQLTGVALAARAHVVPKG